jgi:hypothetical protein
VAALLRGLLVWSVAVGGGRRRGEDKLFFDDLRTETKPSDGQILRYAEARLKDAVSVLDSFDNRAAGIFQLGALLAGAVFSVGQIAPDAPLGDAARVALGSFLAATMVAAAARAPVSSAFPLSAREMIAQVHRFGDAVELHQAATLAFAERHARAASEWKADKLALATVLICAGGVALLVELF